MNKKSTQKLPILVAGANGFTGRFVCQYLIKEKISFIALLRPGRHPGWFKKRNISVRYANLNNYAELTISLQGCSALLNIASIGFGSAPSIIKACKKANIQRVVFISTTAIFTKLNAKSKKVRLNAERIIKESKLNWTILRPTMIFGTPNDRNIIRLIKWIDKYPIIPIFGKGENLMQPVNVKDVASAAVKVLDLDSTFLKTFNISGANAITYNDLIEIIERELQKTIIKIYLPMRLFVIFFKFFEKLAIDLPIKSEQIERLNEDKAFDFKTAQKIFGFNPISIENSIKNEILLYKSSIKKKINS